MWKSKIYNIRLQRYRDKKIQFLFKVYFLGCLHIPMKRVCISTALNSQFHAVAMLNLLSHTDTNLIHIHTHQLTKPTRTSQTTDTHQNHIWQIPPTILNLHIILNLCINLNPDLNTDTSPLLPTTPLLLPIIPPPLPTTLLRHPTEKNDLLIKPWKKL